MQFSEIDWSDKTAPISYYFRVHEALYLPSWAIYHQPSLEEQQAIARTAEWMDEVREFLERPINVHCWIRPSSVNCIGSVYHGRDYNAAVGGAKGSAHRLGRAVDFDAGGECGDDRIALLGQIAILGLRMENRSGPWIHLDDMPVPPGHKRYFTP